ncbi:MAG: glucose 1-dehydrogenase [Deltaproteobacteria bacterium]|nr:glucose 1-dehydrogenase [Deltaproteobacteria bacterium]
MKAGVVKPGQKDSARLIEMDMPVISSGQALVRLLELGIDGTDMEINRGEYGEAPPEQDFIILGHEAVGQIENPGTTKLSNGDLVVPLVRRPDECINCRSGKPDMCIEGNYRECGIRGAHGFLREYLAEEPKFLVPVPKALRNIAVLTEPTSIATKGIEQAIEFHSRSANPINIAVVLGAGPLGLLTTALLKLHDYSTYTLDIVPRSNVKAQLVESIDANYLDGNESPLVNLPDKIGNLDLIIEATGNSTVAFQAMSALGTNGVLCLMGVSTGEKPLEICADCLNMQMVLGNKMVFGTVSSNRGHFERSTEALSCIEEKWPGWLSNLITRRLRLDEFTEGLRPSLDNIKTVFKLT